MPKKVAALPTSSAVQKPYPTFRLKSPHFKLLKKAVQSKRLNGLLVFGLAWSLYSHAEVNLINGDYYVGAVDFEYLSGMGQKLNRVYNSKHKVKGMLGWGWGTLFDTVLAEESDGTILIREYGSGKENRFLPISYDSGSLQSDVDELFEVARKKGLLTSPAMVKQYKVTLKRDLEYRLAQRRLFEARSWLEPKRIRPGIQFRSSEFPDQFLKKDSDGFTRTLGNGVLERFNLKGRYSRIKDVKGNSLDFSYEKDGHLYKIEDNFNRKIIFSCNSQGLIKSAEDERGKLAGYQYNNLDELIGVTSIGSPPTQYDYDDQGRHQLIKIIQNNSAIETISYYGAEKRENVRTLTDSFRVKSEYKYQFNPDQLIVEVQKSDSKNTISNEIYQFQFKERKNGQDWISKVIHQIDRTASGSGIRESTRSETSFDERCGLPSKISKNSKTAHFYFDDRCRAYKKESSSGIELVTYDKVSGKVSLVKRFSPGSRLSLAQTKPSYWVQFQYDNGGRVSKVQNSNNKASAILYDNLGRIKSFVNKNGSQIIFTYDEQSKPIAIRDSKLGSLRIVYKNDGTVQGYSGNQSNKIQERIKSMYLEVIAMVNSASIELTP